jgi:MtN3 and saliva related transmembrane protein
MNHLSITELLGYLSGLISTLSFLPQVVKVWRGYAMNGISIGMYTLYATSLLLWSVYAWLIGSYALLVTEVVTGFLVGYILLNLVQKT